YAHTTDAHTFEPMLAETAYFVGRQVPVRLTDAGYATGPNLASAEKGRGTLYAPWETNDPPKKAEKKKQTTKEAFRGDEQEQTYYCPQGHRLAKVRERVFRRSGTETPLVEYRCAPAACLGCPQARQCARNPSRGRTISRNQHEEQIEALRQRMNSGAG